MKPHTALPWTSKSSRVEETSNGPCIPSSSAFLCPLNSDKEGKGGTGGSCDLVRDIQSGQMQKLGLKLWAPVSTFDKLTSGEPI